MLVIPLPESKVFLLSAIEFECSMVGRVIIITGLYASFKKRYDRLPPSKLQYILHISRTELL